MQVAIEDIKKVYTLFVDVKRSTQFLMEYQKVGRLPAALSCCFVLLLRSMNGVCVGLSRFPKCWRSKKEASKRVRAYKIREHSTVPDHHPVEVFGLLVLFF